VTSTFLPAPPDADFAFSDTPTHPAAERLNDYWLGKCANRPMPDRSDINLADLSDIAPHLVIMEPAGDGDFRIRLFGSALTQMTGQERTGMLVSEMRNQTKGNIGQRWTAMTAYTAKEQCPAYSRAKASVPGREHLIYHAILLPLTNGGDEVAQIFGALFTTYTRSEKPK
jgi:hypothetical protein